MCCGGCLPHPLSNAVHGAAMCLACCLARIHAPVPTHACDVTNFCAGVISVTKLYETQWVAPYVLSRLVAHIPPPTASLSAFQQDSMQWAWQTTAQPQAPVLTRAKGSLCVGSRPGHALPPEAPVHPPPSDGLRGAHWHAPPHPLAPEASECTKYQMRHGCT